MAPGRDFNRQRAGKLLATNRSPGSDSLDRTIRRRTRDPKTRTPGDRLTPGPAAAKSSPEQVRHCRLTELVEVDLLDELELLA
jgi:hypothetical protein